MFKGGYQDVSIDQSSFYDVNPIALKLFFKESILDSFVIKGLKENPFHRCLRKVFLLDNTINFFLVILSFPCLSLI